MSHKLRTERGRAFGDYGRTATNPKDHAASLCVQIGA